MSSSNLYLALWLIATLILCQACESRQVTVQRPDGTVVAYKRTSIFADSNSDGLSLVRDGDDIALEVKPTGSKTDLEALLGAIQAGMKLAAPVPVP